MAVVLLPAIQLKAALEMALQDPVLVELEQQILVVAVVAVDKTPAVLVDLA